MNGTAMSFGMDTQIVRDRIAQQLRAIGRSAKEIARDAGVSPRTVEKWRAGTSLPAADAMFALARTHGEIWEIVKEECGRANDIDEAVAMIDRVRELLQEKSA